MSTITMSYCCVRGELDGVLGDLDRVAHAVARLGRVDGDAGALGDDGSWLTAFGPLEVAGDQQRGVALPCSHLPSLPASVVLPAPCRPASMITVGGCLAKRSRRVSPPRMVTSSSLTILMTCCAGFSACETSAPSARSFTLAMKARTAGSATSASSSAIRISRAVASMSASDRRPLPRRFLKVCCEAVGEGVEHGGRRSSGRGRRRSPSRVSGPDSAERPAAVPARRGPARRARAQLSAAPPPPASPPRPPWSAASGPPSLPTT